MKQACQKAGIDLELKIVTASVYFSSDVANPDTYTKFYSDMQMYNTTMPQPDPELFMNQFCSWEVSTKDNKWQGRNITRWRNDDYDKAYSAARKRARPGEARRALHPHERPAVENRVVIPLVNRPRRERRISNKLRAPMSGWDNDVWLLKDWYREG